MNCFPMFSMVLFTAKDKRQKKKNETCLQLAGTPKAIGFWLIFGKTTRVILDD